MKKTIKLLSFFIKKNLKSKFHNILYVVYCSFLFCLLELRTFLHPSPDLSPNSETASSFSVLYKSMICWRCSHMTWA